MPEKSHGLDAIGSHVQMDGPIRLVEGFLRQPHVTRTVLHQEDFYGHAVSPIVTIPPPVGPESIRCPAGGSLVLALSTVLHSCLASTPSSSLMDFMQIPLARVLATWRL